MVFIIKKVFGFYERTSHNKMNGTYYKKNLGRTQKKIENSNYFRELFSFLLPMYKHLLRFCFLKFSSQFLNIGLHRDFSFCIFFTKKFMLDVNADEHGHIRYKCNTVT